EALQPEPRLRILPQLDQTTQLRQEALRQVLPRQAPVTGLLANLSMLDRNTSLLQALPEPVQRAISQVLVALPTHEQLSRPDGLRHAMESAGTQFESRLIAAMQGLIPSASVSADTKGQLANLLNAVFRALTARPPASPSSATPPPSTASPPPPPASSTLQPGSTVTDMLAELFRQSDGALSRIQTSQLLALASDGQLPWWFELPVRHGQQSDLLQLVVDRDTGDSDARERHWTVRLSFHFEGWGPVHCTVGLQGGTVSTSWWAEQADAASLVDRHLGELRQRLDELGFSVGGMRCVHGVPPAPPTRDRGDGGLIDEQA
ncbi:MAG: flagellar hook-length control protein FliK, partial [Ectothiorhodospiraceae bacterium]|nr:flagellar hook-length control protein FliK [Ectothiorhodospiraceae bacterium]